MNKLIFDVCQSTGSYTDSTGQEKKRWKNCGVGFQDEDGRISLKLEAYPLPNEKGEVWVNFFPKESTAQPSNPVQQAAQQATQNGAQQIPQGLPNRAFNPPAYNAPAPAPAQQQPPVQQQAFPMQADSSDNIPF